MEASRRRALLVAIGVATWKYGELRRVDVEALSSSGVQQRAGKEVCSVRVLIDGSK